MDLEVANDAYILYRSTDEIQANISKATENETRKKGVREEKQKYRKRVSRGSVKSQKLPFQSIIVSDSEEV